MERNFKVAILKEIVNNDFLSLFPMKTVGDLTDYKLRKAIYTLRKL